MEFWAFLIPMRALHFGRVSDTTLNSGGGGFTAQLFWMGVYFENRGLNKYTTKTDRSEILHTFRTAGGPTNDDGGGGEGGNVDGDGGGDDGGGDGGGDGGDGDGDDDGGGGDDDWTTTVLSPTPKRLCL